MGKVKTKKQRKKRARKLAPGYQKPEDAVGCAAFENKTHPEAKRFAVKAFNDAYITALFEECGDNVSEMARRADVSRQEVRSLLRAAGRMV